MPCLAKLSSRFFGAGSVKVRLKAISSFQLMRNSPTTPRRCIRRAQSAASAPLTGVFLGSQPRSAQAPLPEGAMVDHRYRPPRSPDASGRHLRGGTGADDNEVVTIHSLPFATLLVGLYLNDSALQLSVTDHVVSDGFVLIKSIVLDPNCFGPAERRLLPSQQ